MMQCGKCDHWVHAKCENLTGELTVRSPAAACVVLQKSKSIVILLCFVITVVYFCADATSLLSR